MSGGTSRARRPKAITLVGLNERMEEFKALPAKLRQQIAGIINEQAKETRADLIQRITADGFSEASVKARIKIGRASSKKDEDTISLDKKRVPFSRVKFTTATEDKTGTRASVFVQRGGKRVQVYGFVNPYGKKQKPLIRYEKAGKKVLVQSSGVGLKQWWDGIITEQYITQIQKSLEIRITQEIGL